MGLARDDVYEALRSRRRRFAVHYLQQHGGRTSLETLAERVSTWEPEADGTVASSHVEDVYRSLEQRHLPTLAELGMVEFDRRTGDVELTDEAANLQLYLEVVRERDVPWSLYYLAVGTLGGVSILTSVSGAVSILPLSDIELGFVVVAVLGVLSLAHTVYTRRMRLGRDGPPPELVR